MFSTSHSLCCQPWWFPKAFAFYDPLNLLALELGFVLKSEQREAFWSLTLICESITVQFQTFVLHLKQILVEKDAPSSRTMKSSFFRRLDSFGDVSPFLVGETTIFLELIHPPLISQNCVVKQQPQLSQALGSFSFLPFLGAGTGFFSVLPLIFDLPENTALHREMMLKTCFGIFGYRVHQ